MLLKEQPILWLTIVNQNLSGMSMLQF